MDKLLDMYSSTGKQTVLTTLADVHEWAANTITELEADIVTRRLDYTEDCKRLDARIADLEQQLAAMTAERDSESRWAKKYSDEADELRQQLAAAQEREATYTEYKRKLEAIVTWLEHNEQGVFARGLWDVLYK